MAGMRIFSVICFCFVFRGGFVLFVCFVFHCFCRQTRAVSKIFQFLTLLATRSVPLFVFLPWISGKGIMHKFDEVFIFIFPRPLH